MDVLIAGGGLSGLTMAALLGRYGLACLVVESARDVPRAPRNHRLNPRTMAVLRGAGLERPVRAIELGYDSGGLIMADTLTGRAGTRLPSPWQPVPPQVSEVPVCVCNERDLETVMRTQARERGAELRLGATLTGFEVRTDQVTGVLRDGTTIEARYLIAAGGPPLRDAAGVPAHGPDNLGRQLTISFRADLDLRDGYLLGSVNGLLLPEEPGVFGLTVAMTDLTPERCVELIRTAAGHPDLPVELVDRTPLEISARIADRFVRGRVLLAGKSAYSSPPTPGLMGNARIQDAHNLAWKLALVLSGQAGPALLDSYDTERRPLAELTVRDALSRLPAHMAAPAEPLPVDRLTFELGFRYGDGDRFEDPRTPSLLPGGMIPHFDLSARSFVLLAGSDEQRWRAAAEPLGIEVRPGGTGPEALLVRPDGFVAWRSADPDHLAEALDRLLHRERL
ncbi:FAD-dependent monooxygenase [Nonomuraea sp. NPDC059007]|uniref:FAD-dependent monooxygenase n=1 Tax=Nonomuraea sp. NPDC059007 TaxID=3346692 RepID=UPI0036999855